MSPMLQTFGSVFRPDEAGLDLTMEAPRPSAFRAALGGRSFGGGLYRIHTQESASRTGRDVLAAFPGAPAGSVAYGFDWLGRQFCAVSDEPSATTVMLEPGTGEVLEIPVPFASIHDEEFAPHGDAALAADFFAQYLANGGQPPSFTECIGYEKPLFLGGVDAVANLRLQDVDVYWEVSAQLISRVRGLPAGTRLDEIELR